MAWVSNSLLVAIPLHDASFSDSRGSERATVASQKATVGSLRQRAVVIDLAAANSARVFNIAVSGGLNGVAGPGPSPGTLLIAADNAVDRYGVTADSMTASGSVPVPSGGIVEALSPDGRDALYLLRGGISTPPPTEPVGPGVTAPPPPYQSGIQLWEATMGRSFSSPRLVFGNAQLYGAAW